MAAYDRLDFVENKNHQNMRPRGLVLNQLHNNQYMDSDS